MELIPEERAIFYGIATKSRTNVDSALRLALDHKVAGTYPFAPLGNRDPVIGLPKIDQECHLNPYEIHIANYIGRLRNEGARKKKLVNMHQDHPDNEFYNEYIGLAGELLFGKYHNLYPYETLAVVPRKAVDDNGDYDWNGVRIDVKATKHEGGVLFVSHWKQAEGVSAFCLFTGDYEEGKMTFRGWMSGKNLMQEKRYKPLPKKKNPVWQAKQSLLEESIHEV